MKAWAMLAGCCLAGCVGAQPLPQSQPSPQPQPSPQSRASSPALGQQFDLALTRRATIADGGLTLVFAGVKEDSRCPRGVQCIWAGRVSITVNASKPGAAPKSLTLTLPKPATADYAGYTVTLIALEPRPVVRGRKPGGKRMATLLVRKK